MKPKRAKPFAANSASIKRLESEGWTCSLVEQRIPHCFITRDAFGFGDILCCSPSRGIMMVQATGGGNGPARVKKILAEPRAGIWIASGGRVVVHDWCKVRGANERECRITNILPQHNDKDTTTIIEGVKYQ